MSTETATSIRAIATPLALCIVRYQICGGGGGGAGVTAEGDARQRQAQIRKNYACANTTIQKLRYLFHSNFAYVEFYTVDGTIGGASGRCAKLSTKNSSIPSIGSRISFPPDQTSCTNPHHLDHEGSLSRSCTLCLGEIDADTSYDLLSPSKG